MASYQIRFTRYNRNTVERRQSGTIHHSATSFAAAFAHAETMRRGMEAADPDTDYAVMSISTNDYHGTDCEGGIRMWETPSESRDRIALANATGG